MTDRSRFRRAQSQPRRRPVDTIEPRQRFLIVCEGEKTEPNYFKKYRVPGLIVEVEGIGQNTYRVVEHAIKRRKQERKRKEDFDQVWCVFDRDSFPAQHFNRALELADQNGIRAAYSNEAFELWYLLHFQYQDSAIARSLYVEKLKTFIDGYEKNSDEMYDKLRAHRETAIKNATRLLNRYNPRNPERDNPSTTVHLLIEELIKSLPG
jgi:hypothetical protein